MFLQNFLNPKHSKLKKFQWDQIQSQKATTQSYRIESDPDDSHDFSSLKTERFRKRRGSCKKDLTIAISDYNSKTYYVDLKSTILRSNPMQATST
ncbi:hypothetical protein ACOSQ2_021879 [Xanthoceras sorbifolium]